MCKQASYWMVVVGCSGCVVCLTLIFEGAGLPAVVGNERSN